MVACPSCFAEQTNTSTFCSECGAALSGNHALAPAIVAGETPLQERVAVPCRLRGFVWAALLIALVVLAYLPAMDAGYIWDDDDYVTENDCLRDLDGLRRIWVEPTATPQYYPLVHTMFWIEYRLWSLDPRGFHIVNIVLHACVALLVWKLLVRLEVPGAWVAAAVFALHPVHVESVAWITERKNVLSGLFYCAAMWFYLRFTGIPRPAHNTDTWALVPPQPSQWGFYVAALFCFLCALLSKTVTASLPAAIVLMFWWKRQRMTSREILTLLPLFAAGVGAGLLTVWLETHHVGASGVDWNYSFVQRCLIAGRALLFYSGKLIFPRQLTFNYPLWNIDSFVWWQYAFPAGVAAVLVGLYLKREQWGRGPLTSVLYFMGTLFPVLGFLNTFPMRYSFVADHFQYLASIGLIALATAALAGPFNRLASKWRDLGVIGVAALLMLLVGLTWRQSRVYHDVEILWRDTLQKNPESWLAYNNYGRLLSDQGYDAEAERYFRRSLDLKPDFAIALANLGNVLYNQGETLVAIEHFEATLKIDPNHLLAAYGLGAAYRRMGQYERSERWLKTVVENNPNFGEAHHMLATVLSAQDRDAEAIPHFEKACRIDPHSASSHYALTRIYRSRGNYDSARTHFEEALKRQPNQLDVRSEFADFLASRQEYEDAIRQYRQIIITHPSHVAAYKGLAEALRELGKTDEADKYFEQYRKAAVPASDPAAPE